MKCVSCPILVHKNDKNGLIPFFMYKTERLSYCPIREEYVNIDEEHECGVRRFNDSLFRNRDPCWCHHHTCCIEVAGMNRGYAGWLCCDSKYATKEQKRITIDAIVNAGVEGINTKELRKLNGLTPVKHNQLMRVLREYDGRIQRVGKDAGSFNVWGVYA